MLLVLSRGRKVALITALVGAVTMLGQTAQAVPVYLDGGSVVTLFGGGQTRWDAYNFADPCDVSNDAYTPVSDGEQGTNDYKSDAYDDGLVLLVGNTGQSPSESASFRAPNDIADKAGEQLRTGPVSLRGLQVTRWDRALSGSPTMRSLVALNNRSGSARTRDIYWTGNLGSDSSTGIRRTSNNSANLVNASRWVVTSDNEVSSSLFDPVLTHVLWGTGAAVRTAEVVDNPVSGDDCITVRMRVRVPANSARYLLFYTEMNRTNQLAISNATKFNRRGLNNSLLAGIGPAVRNRVVNWDLG